MTTYTTTVTVPTFLRDKVNGELLPEWLRSPDDHMSAAYKLFVPVSYAMQALHFAAEVDGVLLRTTGRYRSLERQTALFLERYSPVPIPGRPMKTWQGQTWWQKPGVAMAATPGTSNHGLGLADDVAEEDTVPADAIPESLGWDDIAWLDSHQAAYGFGLETTKELWHRHWVGGDRLSQLVVDVLHVNGVDIPDLTGFGFTVPAPTPPPPPPDPGDDDLTPEQSQQLDEIHRAMFDNDYPFPGMVNMRTQIDRTYTIMGTFWDGFPGNIKDGPGVLARTIKNIATKVGAKVG